MSLSFFPLTSTSDSTLSGTDVRHDHGRPTQFGAVGAGTFGMHERVNT